MLSRPLTQKSKFLSLVLRHQPEAAGVTLDDGGWIEIATLLAGCAAHGSAISSEELAFIVANNDKKRFVIDGDRIRAAQGHSIEVELGYKPIAPPTLLWHGTVPEFLDSIYGKGLLKGARQHVHLSESVETAIKVGQRRGKPVVLTVRALEMHDAGHVFYRTPNNVWLVEHVPPKFIEEVER